MFRKLCAPLVIAALCIAPAWSAGNLIGTTGAGGIIKPPAAGGGCTASTNFLARTSISGAAATDYQNFICGLVTDGVITGNLSGARGCGTNLDLLYVMGAPNSTDALLNLCGTSYSLVGHGSPGFVADNGFTGVDGSSTVYLDTQFNPVAASGTSAWVIANAHISAWSNTSAQASAAGGNIMGLTSTGPQVGSSINPRYPTNIAFLRLQEQGGGGTVASTDGSGHWLVVRTGALAANEIAYHNAVNQSIGGDAVQSADVNANIFLLAGDALGSGATGGSGAQLFMASAGKSMSSTLVTALCHRTNVLANARNGTSLGKC